VKKIEVTIRVDREGGQPHTNIGYVVDGKDHYFTRLNYIVNDTPHSRAHELAMFKRRQGWMDE
jgi:hypothetical protein